MTPQQEARLQYAKDSVHERPPDIIDPSAIIEEGAFVGGDGFGYARDYDGTPIEMKHAGNVVIGKNVRVGGGARIDRAVNGSTVIGDNCKIQGGAHVGHGAKIGKNAIIVTGAKIAGGVVIGDNCTLWMNCDIVQKLTIGNNCVIGVGSVVLADVPDNTIVKGLWKGIKPLEVKYNLVK